MKIIIFSINSKYKKNLIEEVFKKNSKHGVYLCLDQGKQKFCDTLKISELIRAEPLQLSDVERENILNGYIDLIGNISTKNQNSREWWASDIASKNRTLSPMLGLLNNIVFSTTAIKLCSIESKDLYIFGANSPTVTFLKECARLEGASIQIIGENFINDFYLNCKTTFKKYFFLFKSILSSLKNLIYVSFPFRGVDKIDKNKPTILIKSFTFPSAFLSEKKYKDPFFSGLDFFLKKKFLGSTQVITVSQGFSDRYRLYKKMKSVHGQIIFPIEKFLRMKDVFLGGASILRFWLFDSIKIPKKIFFLKNNLSSTLQEMVDSAGDSIPFGDYLYYYLARRIAKSYKLQTCYMTYEGNHWERMFIMGLREIRPNIEIIGYQHAAIPQSAAGIFISCKEISLIPHPDRVITTGERITEILHKNSCLPKNRIQSGCALRYQYLYSLVQSPIRKISRNTYTILLVLGDLDSLSLLLYAIKEAKLLSDVNFIIRTHPILPLEQFFSICGMDYSDLPNNMSVSNIDYVQGDIERCDTVLYWSSSVALEALMMGKSLIYFDRGDVLSFDPMSFIDFNDLKWTVQFDESILSIVDEVTNMKHSEFVVKVNKGREHIMDYFSQENKENMKVFIPETYNI
jgi:hypothetical protein